MFAFVAGEWPVSIVVEQPTAFGTRRLVAYKLDEVTEDDGGRECDRCLMRKLESTIYRDSFGLKVWHPQCFSEELTAKRAERTWRVTRLEWKEHRITR